MYSKKGWAVPVVGELLGTCVWSVSHQDNVFSVCTSSPHSQLGARQEHTPPWPPVAPTEWGVEKRMS